MNKNLKRIMLFATLAALCGCGAQSASQDQGTAPAAEPTVAKSVQIGSGTVNLTADMSCGDVEKNNDDISTLYVYFQPEIPEEMKEVCYILSHVNAIDYSEVNMTAEQARGEYTKYFPILTDFLTDDSGYLDRTTDMVEINGLPAYHFKANYKNGSYIEGYTILTDKYDTMTVEYVHTGSSEEHQKEFQWILDHIETKKFEIGNTVATAPVTTTTPSNPRRPNSCPEKTPKSTTTTPKKTKY